MNYLKKENDKFEGEMGVWKNVNEKREAREELRRKLVCNEWPFGL